MNTWTLAKKDLRLLLRDPRALVILLAMPLIFILVMGLALGDSFGQKPDERLRVSIVDLDKGYVEPAPIREGLAWLVLTPGSGPAAPVGSVAFQQASRHVDQTTRIREGMAWFALTPGAGRPMGGAEGPVVGVVTLAEVNRSARSPREAWSQVVRRDLAETAGIRVEVIPNVEQAERLVRDGDRSAVFVFGPNFSDRVAQCSFLADGINPFYRDGVDLKSLDAWVLRDPTQAAAASIIEQVAQVALLRVVLPWMIGRAFAKLGDPTFLDLMAERVHLDVPVLGRVQLKALLKSNEHKQQVGDGIKRSLQELFPKYNLTGQTWASLTRSDPKLGGGAGSAAYREDEGGFLGRGSVRYQILVPNNTVLFAFFLVLTVGWLFVAERRQGTLKRLRAAPVTRREILLGKLLPCYLLSIGQGFLLLVAGKVVFGMKWGPEPLWLVPVVLTTSLAAMGLALLVASLARTETQVAIYGTLLVLVLAGVSGCMMPRELMPEQMKKLSRVTPQAWALDAYNQLLNSPTPNYAIVETACLVLAAFGVGFVLLAWASLRLD